MPIQEERIEALERTTKEHGAALRTLSYELIIIKDLVTAQGEAIQDIKDDMDGSFTLLTDYHKHMERQIDARFDKIEATMATKDDLAAMESRVREDMAAMESRLLGAFQQLVKMINK